MYRIIVVIFLVTGSLHLLVSTGCGGGSSASNDAATPQEQTVDPRFASQEAILKHYNEISTREPALDQNAFVELLYAENPEQERLVKLTKDSVPIVELEQAAWEKFGDCLLQPKEHAPLAPHPEPAKIVSESDGRFVAEQRTPSGEVDEIHFVQIGDRWWISGYTLEYNPEFQNVGIENLDRAEKLVTYVNEVIPDIRREMSSTQLGGGGPSNIDYFRARLVRMITQRHPDAAQLFAGN